MLLQHVVRPYELPYDLLALLPARLQIFYEVDLADVVASEGADGSPTVLLRQAALQDGQGVVDFETPLDRQVAIEVRL